MLGSPGAAAADTDLHRLWDDRCLPCHGHSGRFAREFLRVVDDRLTGRHHSEDVRRFMYNHYRVEAQVDAVYDMLKAQASTPPRFESECAKCHLEAANFVRERLELREGTLVSRTSGRPVQGFLDGHVRLTGSDAAFFTAVLTRVAGEVHQPREQDR